MQIRVTRGETTQEVVELDLRARPGGIEIWTVRCWKREADGDDDGDDDPAPINRRQDGDAAWLES